MDQSEIKIFVKIRNSPVILQSIQELFKIETQKGCQHRPSSGGTNDLKQSARNRRSQGNIWAKMDQKAAQVAYEQDEYLA
jgi:hypothetical protein